MVLGGVAGPGCGGCAWTPRAPNAATAPRLSTKRRRDSIDLILDGGDAPPHLAVDGRGPDAGDGVDEVFNQRQVHVCGRRMRFAALDTLDADSQSAAVEILD